MTNKEFLDKNPIRLLKTEDVIGGGHGKMGLVISRAGLGKTAILVQIALDSLIKGKDVIHISIGQTIDKTRLWYDDMFKDITSACGIQNPAEVYDEIMRRRMIMTFKESRFSRPKLEERLNDLVYQDIIKPSCVVVDGYDFVDADRKTLEDIREMVAAMGINMWFTAVSHRDDTRASADGVPAPCHEMADLFDTVIVLQPAPQKECIDLNIVKETSGAISGEVLKLDPITFMVKECD